MFCNVYWEFAVRFSGRRSSEVTIAEGLDFRPNSEQLDRSSSPRYVHQRLHRAVTTGSTNINGSVRRAGSQGRGPASCSPPLQALNPGLGPTLARYPSSDSLHSYSSAATLTAGSVHSAKSSPSLCRDPAVREHDKWDPVGEEDYIEMAKVDFSRAKMLKGPRKRVKTFKESI
ncbi:unnamed protein product [Notodromas monacha]|uniref:Uncharacterized protein n=1 Tax=Notodromas monacha TaxID=399045 RepID=A0A7R9GBZ8_9CRUS|nr:unnamed protein product [Notodromas monacha]CAG0916939.1 unnamed protein product [Notodromas monacha]